MSGDWLAWAVVVGAAQATFLTVGMLVGVVLINGDTWLIVHRTKANYQLAGRR